MTEGKASIPSSKILQCVTKKILQILEQRLLRLRIGPKRLPHTA